jgi:hypothetical protein
MYQRLKKLKSHQIKEVYCKIMRVKNTSLKKDKMISKLLAPLQKKYRMEIMKKMSPKSKDYLEDLTKKAKNIQLNLYDQKVKVRLPSFKQTSFSGDYLVGSEEKEQGDKITIEEIKDLMDYIVPSKLTDDQRKEVRRLFAIAYTNKYKNEWLFGKGEYAKTYGNRDLTERKKYRAKLLKKLGDINGIDFLRKTHEFLPLPLWILRKAKLNRIPESDRYPINKSGTVDQTNDIFWPRTEADVFNFLYKIPTVEEIQNAGW